MDLLDLAGFNASTIPTGYLSSAEAIQRADVV
jgi:hypothetical protein